MTAILLATKGIELVAFIAYMFKDCCAVGPKKNLLLQLKLHFPLPHR